MSHTESINAVKIGIFGGTFDPVHYGHLLLAETCREQLALEEIRFIPAGNPPHKAGAAISDGHARADMLKLALSGYPEYQVDRRELRRQGPSFTVDTLTEFRTEYPDAELFFLMGADSLVEMPTWRQPERIVELATVVAVNRPGTRLPSSEWLAAKIGTLAGQIQLISMPGTDLSASDLRQRIRDGRELRFMTPKAVEAFIHQHRIYL